MSAGDEASSAAIQIMEQRSRSIDQLSELAARILENLSQRSDFTKEDNRGTKALLKHLDNGRNIDIIPFNKEEVKMLDEILHGMKKPYVMVFDKKEEKMMLMTRDSDREVLKDTLRQYAIGKGIEKREMAKQQVFPEFSLFEQQKEKMLHEQI